MERKGKGETKETKWQEGPVTRSSSYRIQSHLTQCLFSKKFEKEEKYIYQVTVVRRIEIDDYGAANRN